MDLKVMQVDRGGVEDALSRSLGKKVSMEKSPLGAPYLEGDDHYVSLSHKDSHLVVALSSRPVGIDIEKIQEKPGYYRIAERYFPEKIAEGDIERFFRSWTKREAFGKLLGTGLTPDVMGMDFSADSLCYKGETVYFVEQKTEDYLVMTASYFDKGIFEWKGEENHD